MTYFWNKKVKASYILAILVFCIHCSSFIQYDAGNTIPYLRFGAYLTKQTINKAAVPLFFIISGALFYRNYTNEKYREKLLRRVRSLVIPYIAWNTLNMLFEFAATTFLSDYFVTRQKAVISLPNILLGIFHYKYYLPFWFIFALIIFAAAAPVIDKLLYSKTTSVLSIIALIVLNYFGFGLPAALFFDRTCIIYYLVGGLIGRYYFDLFAKRGGVSRSTSFGQYNGGRHRLLYAA